MQGTVSIKFSGEEFSPNPKRSAIPRGPLVLPEGATVAGSLIAFGEDDEYLHCIISDTGAYYGVFKSEKSDHLYRLLLELNCGSNDQLGPLPEAEWLAGAHTQAWRAETVRSWPAHNAARYTVPLYALTPEDVAAVNAARKDAAWKASRRLGLCRCDHIEYCQHCFPVAFRAGGVWGGPNVRAKAGQTAQEEP